MPLPRLFLAVTVLSLVPCAADAGRWSLGLHFGLPGYGHCWHHHHHRPLVVAPVYPVYVAPAPLVVQPAVVAVPAAPAAAPAAATAYAPPETAEPALLEAPRPVARAASWNGGSDLEALNDPSPRTRAEAILRLGRARDRRAVSVLVRSLQDDNHPEVRDAAARALGLIGSPQALAALQHAAGADDDRDVRRSASFAAEVIRATLQR